MMDSYLSSVTLECKKKKCRIPNYNYLLCPLCLLPGKSSLFCYQGETALSGYKQALKSSSLLCNCLQLFVVCSCYVGGGQNAKPVDVLGVWPLSGPVLCWIKRGTGPFLLQPPRRVCSEGNQQWCFHRRWRSSCALPLPASPSLSGEVCTFHILTGPRCPWSCSRCQGWDSRDVPWSQPAGV